MQNFERAAAVILLGTAIFLGLDIVDDLQHGSDWKHVGLESVMILLSMGMLLTFLLQAAQKIRLKEKHQDNLTTNALKERDLWRERAASFLDGLSEAIDAQFTNWGLSNSEKEIGLLLLKGLAHKEIAIIRNTSEHTVRQQAGGLYAKAGLANKSQLSAFFLEDLILPSPRMPTRP